MDGTEEARMDGVGTGKLEWIGEEVVKLEWMEGEEARMYVVRVGKLERMKMRKLGCMW